MAKRNTAINDSTTFQASGAASHETSVAAAASPGDNTENTNRPQRHQATSSKIMTIFRNNEGHSSPSPSPSPLPAAPPEPTFDYFLSDPSHSESEDVDESQIDRQRQLLYRQKRLNQNKNNYNHSSPHGRSDWDASSFGNTSLSSSNVSPMPKFKIQFDHSLSGDNNSNSNNNGNPNGVSSGGLNFNSLTFIKENTSQQQNQQPNQGSTSKQLLGDVTKKIRQRLPFVRMASETSDSISSVDFDYKIQMPWQFQSNKSQPKTKEKEANGGTTSLNGDVDIMEAALLPPSSDGGLVSSSHYGFEQNDVSFEENNNSKGQQVHQSTTETERHADDATTEQTGGESSSSAALSTKSECDRGVVSGNNQNNGVAALNDVTNGSKSVNNNTENNSSNNANNNNSSNSTSPTSKKTKLAKKRLRFSKSQPSPSTHRRQRSGDHMAAGIVLKNTQQEVDWIGMRLSGFPTPDNNSRSGKDDMRAYGSMEPFGAYTEGESMSSSPSINNPWLKSALPRKSSHLSFSDSSVPESPPENETQSHPLQQNKLGGEVRSLNFNGQQEPPSHLQEQQSLSFSGYQQEQRHHHQQRPHSRSLSSYHEQHQQQSYQMGPHRRSFSGYQQFQQQMQQIQNKKARPLRNSLSSYDQVWDGENCLRYVPNRGDNYYGSHHVSWDPQYGSWSSSSGIQYGHSARMPTANATDNIFQANLGLSLRGSDSIESSSGIMYSTRIPEGKRAMDGVAESDSSGSTESASSSSFDDDNTSMSRLRDDEFQKLEKDHHTLRRDSKASGKFDKAMRRFTTALNAPAFNGPKKKEEIDDSKPPPTFFCPNCKTRQRAFFDITSASSQFESPFGVFALYFALYLVAVLFVFGLEEGWTPLECVYFAVITLTTAGLGDYVPSSDAAKLICACFIYFGVATIGLLLGTILAGSLDDASKKDHHDSLVRDCPNCLRLEMQKKRFTNSIHKNDFNSNHAEFEPMGQPFRRANINCNADDEEEPSVGLDINDSAHDGAPLNTPMAQPASNTPTSRKSYTKHMSLALDAAQAKAFFDNLNHSRRKSADFKTINENTPFLDKPSSSILEEPTQHSFDSKQMNNDDPSTSSTSSKYSSNLAMPMTRLKAVKYIVLTLNRALLNSLLIIFIGSTGFYLIEGMTLVDSFYFTTVLLTTVGYGDIVPVSDAGKVFTTVYVIVAGTILLHNMSLISMIPLELRKHRIEQAVLGQFGSQLTDDELQELSTGRLIQRLKLATNRPDGLNECTREMFSLAMLVRLGRITEDDVKATFAAFSRLDKGNYGTLNSRTVIEGEIWRIRSCKNLSEMAAPQPLNPLRHRSYSFDSLEMSQVSVNFNPYTYVMQSPNPYMNPIANVNSHPSLRRMQSEDDSKQSAMPPGFDFDAYDLWSRDWQHGYNDS